MMAQKKWINVLIMISIFVSSIVFFKEPFEGYLHYFIFFLLFPFFIGSFGAPTKTFMLLALPLLIGGVQILLGNNEPGLFFKIFAGVLLSMSFYDYTFSYFQFDVEKVFRLYLQGALIVSYIGIVQFVSYRVGFTPGYNYNWLFNKWGVVPGGLGIRVNSIFSEASQFAIVIAPASFVAVNNLLNPAVSYQYSRLQSVAILIAMFLTTSSTGYIGLFFVALLLMFNYDRLYYFFIGAAISIVGGWILYMNVPDFQKRIDSSVALWVYGDFSIENVNTSSFVLYNNFHIATENFKSNFLTGTGLGSHPVAYDRYSLTKNEGILDFQFNKADGNSMLIRLTSETGLIGLFFIFWLLYKFYVKRNAGIQQNVYWIISNATLVLIALYLLRQGNYFINGFPFFVLLYYYNKKVYDQHLMQLTETSQTPSENAAQNTHTVH